MVKQTELCNCEMTTDRVLLASKGLQRNNKWHAKGRSERSQGYLILEKKKFKF